MIELSLLAFKTYSFVSVLWRRTMALLRMRLWRRSLIMSKWSMIDPILMIHMNNTGWTTKGLCWSRPMWTSWSGSTWIHHCHFHFDFFLKRLLGVFLQELLLTWGQPPTHFFIHQIFINFGLLITLSWRLWGPWHAHPISKSETVSKTK